MVFIQAESANKCQIGSGYTKIKSPSIFYFSEEKVFFQYASATPQFEFH